MDNKHKYRVNLYLGKETYEQIEQMALFLKLPISTTTKIILTTGLELSKVLEKGVNNGISEQSKV